MKTVCVLSALFVIIVKCLFVNAKDPPGHLQPLGSHVAPLEIDIRDNQLGPVEFFDTYVKPSKPVLLKGACKTFPSFHNWRNDKYLKDNYGDWKVFAEKGKKETRQSGGINVTYGEYLDLYNTSDVYLVSDILPSNSMAAEVFLPKCLLCGGYTEAMVTSVMWFSSGGTKSVLHNDDLENINCLYDGVKELVMIDKKYAHLVPIDRPDGGYSSVDVEKVDMYKYPTLGQVPWYKAKMEAGDCFYIPHRWYHHVYSWKSRNLAINLWWTFSPSLTGRDQCPKNSESLPNHRCLNTLKFQNDEEQTKAKIWDMFNSTTNTIRFEDITSELPPGSDVSLTKEYKSLLKLFRELDADNDNALTYDEVEGASKDVQTRLYQSITGLEELFESEESGDPEVLDEDPEDPEDPEVSDEDEDPQVSDEDPQVSDEDPEPSNDQEPSEVNQPPIGHLQPLGSHTSPQSIEERSDWPNPIEFFENYQKPGKPLLLRGVAKSNPSFQTFQDDSILKEKYGDWMVAAEEGKKENRSLDVYSMKFSKFLDTYQKEDIYLVEDIKPSNPMADIVYLPKSILCGGYTDSLSTVVMWFSSGSTKSVLHNDGFENINCLFEGQKKLVIIDKKYESLVPIDVMDGGYSSLDVDRVDLYKYPTVSKLPWFSVSMSAGDCLYIPLMWYHQVNSMPTRNLAINVWWSHLPQLRRETCPDDLSKLPEYQRLSGFKFVASEDQQMPSLTSLFESGPVTFDQLKTNDMFVGREEELKTLFKKMDANQDGVVTNQEAAVVSPDILKTFQENWDGESPENVRDEL